MSERLNKLKEKIRSLPEKPGIYQYFNAEGTIIYVGKAKNLKKRVNSYFTKNHDTAKTRILVRKIHDLQYIIVDNETDALLLENNLIKKYLPKYNIALKDDKTYPWICIKNERFPRVFTTRRVIKDGSKYFGPYPSVYVVNTLLELMRELFPLRTCNYDLSQEKIDAGKYKVCLEYHIGNCKAPCVGKEKEETYNEYIDQIEHIVKGNIASVIRMLKEKMKSAAETFAFEEAEDFKQKIKALEKYQAKSTVVSPTIHQVDVITLERSENKAYVNYLVINNGTIIHGLTVEVKNKLDESDQEILTFALLNMREKFNSQSKEILIENAADFKVEGLNFFTPQRGDKKHLLDLSQRNAKYFKLQQKKQESLKNPEVKVERILKTIQKDFRLKELPVHMECFDNSNIHGTNPVSACVVFKNAKPSKKDYRHFIIKTVEGPDDFESMREALYRRYKRMLEENQDLPQLVIVDGGKGQLSAGLDALEKLGLKDKVPIVGIAKRLEEIFFPGDSLPLYIDKKSESLKVIQYMRNEAHRFGITHHRNRRSKSALVSELTEIKGIGEKTQEDLMKHFKTLSKIKTASEKELVEVVGLAKAKLLKKQLTK
ncbi:excinuclease ABC subunit C [Brumimicrobium salinarum]|uniref:UvrABC system protein C n=1 Tax=Brumimicrobium salinarum TaxID=2058658 RepID=A0A2I0R0H8_9FLAO|nr:excinuclease ABC subunit UvrC [Brumimicrobium salinarum]PKR80045.1 excinuclease ABC subunit C [Brumimicrobium salinarum]